MKRIFFIPVFLLLCFSCGKHFISDKTYRNTVAQDFAARKDTLTKGDLFSIFDTGKMDRTTREAMMFLYAYMPMGDLTDYPGEFYLKNVKSALSVRNKVPWGKQIPEEVFRHFVLPVRVNNEYLDSARSVLFAEIFPLIKDLSMYDAALEVNHWCHEKVVYRPSNERTSAPLATMKTAFGRCGEESVFAVAALRSVGIPARQVYTPRWAHTDDNHAWVEVWVDGQWYYMGACEPEPKLNIGWFSKTVQRGMLMHTKAFGKYNGPEEQMETTDNYTEINVTSNYAPVSTAKVRVTDAAGSPVEGAEVSFGIYNYARFFPVSVKKSDAQGFASVLSGRGDLFVWVSKGDQFGFDVITSGEKEYFDIRLDKTVGEEVAVSLDVVPPGEGSQEVTVTPEERRKNDLRLVEEDAIRNNYVATFMSADDARLMAREIGFPESSVEQIIAESRGNWKEISDLLRGVAPEERPRTQAILETLLDKDLRDVSKTALLDHIRFSESPVSGALFRDYVLAPRMAFELISPYKETLRREVGDSLRAQAQQNPNVLVDWVRKNIKVNDGANAMKVPMLPLGVWRSGVADRHSRDIFFVSLCRSLGIPARIEGVTGQVQYFHKNSWNNVAFDLRPQAAPGYLRLGYRQVGGLDNPLYDIHFSLSKYEQGAFRLLNFRNADGLEGTASFKGVFSQPVRLEAGYYMLVTGTRMASGKVLSTVKLFRIDAGATKSVELTMREDANDVQVLGSMNPEALFLREGGSQPESILSFTGRGYFVLAILGAKQEPTNHALRDIAVFADRFNKWGRAMVLLFPDEGHLQRFDRSEFPSLPENSVFGTDESGKITEMLAAALKISDPGRLPIVVIADSFGRIVYFSQGYVIGQGEQLLKVIDKL